MSGLRHDGTLARHGRYSTPWGDREIVSVLNPDTGRFVLVDAFEEPQGGDLDARVVDDQLETPAEVEALVARLLRARNSLRGAAQPMTAPRPRKPLQGDEALLFETLAAELVHVVSRSSTRTRRRSTTPASSPGCSCFAANPSARPSGRGS